MIGDTGPAIEVGGKIRRIQIERSTARHTIPTWTRSAIGEQEGHHSNLSKHMLGTQVHLEEFHACHRKASKAESLLYTNVQLTHSRAPFIALSQSLIQPK
jgi:hypothetical protein